MAKKTITIDIETYEELLLTKLKYERLQEIQSSGSEEELVTAKKHSKAFYGSRSREAEWMEKKLLHCVVEDQRTIAQLKEEHAEEIKQERREGRKVIDQNFKEISKLKKSNEELEKSNLELVEKYNKVVAELNRYSNMDRMFTDLSKLILAAGFESLPVSLQELESIDVSQLTDSEKEELQEAIFKISELAKNGIKLKIQSEKDFTNSSMPSSMCKFRGKVHNSRKPSGKKPGGQPGHEFHPRKELEDTEPPIYIPTPPEICEENGWYHVGEVKKQVISLKVQISVQPFYGNKYRQHGTGKRFQTKFPDNCQNEVNYGSNVYAAIYFLHDVCHVSEERTRELLLQLTDGKLCVSHGMIDSVDEKFCARTASEYNAIFDSVAKSDVVYSDMTSVRVNGKLQNVVVCTNKDQVWYKFCEHKGHEAIKGSPIEHSNSILVHDHDTTYLSYGSAHQECNAHHLRYLLGAMEVEKNLTWHKKMHGLLLEMNKVRESYNRNMPEEVITDFENRYDEILKLAEEEYKKFPTTEYVDGYNLYKRLCVKENVLLFLRNPNVDFTNNVSERALRKIKRLMATYGTFRGNGAHSPEEFCRAFTVYESMIHYSDNPFLNLVGVFERPRMCRKHAFS